MRDRRRVTHLAVGFGCGVLAASLGVQIGLTASIVAFAILVVVGGLMPRFAFLAGALLGIGFAWATLALLSARACQATSDFCGQANFLPLIAISVVSALVGTALAVATFVKQRET